MSATSILPLTVMDNHDPELLEELLEAVAEVARSGSFIGGPRVDEFETAFASYCESPHAVGVSSGTEALALAVRALGARPGDQVVVPANSFVATAEAVCLAGATPVFADVDAGTQVVTATTIERALTPQVRGLIPVHLFGRTVAMDEVMGLAAERNLWVVEDCAQAHGARYDGRPVGSWGDAGTFSFYPAKNLGAWGDAGAVITRHEGVCRKVRLLRSHGEEPRYHHQLVGTTGRLDALQAALLARKLTRLEGWNDARRRIAAELAGGIASAPEVAPPAAVEAPHDHVFHQFVVRTPFRDQLRQHLDSQGIHTAIHYPVPIHRNAAFASLANENPAPVATQLSREVCSLPIFPSMTRADVERLVDAVLEFVPAG